MSEVKVSMLVTGALDQFEVTLESLEPLESFERGFYVPCSVSVSPQRYADILSQVCDGQVMYGHFPHYADSERPLISTPERMEAFLLGEGFRVLLSPDFEILKRETTKALTEDQARDKLEQELANAGVVH